MFQENIACCLLWIDSYAVCNTPHPILSILHISIQPTKAHDCATINQTQSIQIHAEIIAQNLSTQNNAIQEFSAENPQHQITKYRTIGNNSRGLSGNFELQCTRF
jgi:hypothetical protein